jgi:hypothetical protein
MSVIIISLTARESSPRLFFEIAKNNYQGGNKLARSNYSFKKRQKELARKKKKEQKRQRKLDKATNIPD